MEKQNKKEEILSRREFFKNAAKKGLPIMAAIALVNIPITSQALGYKSEKGCEDCWGKCDGSCYSTCKGTCEGSCLKGCKTSCYGTCDSTCTAGCGKSSK